MGTASPQLTSLYSEVLKIVATPEGGQLDSPAHTTCVKYNSRHRIQDDQGSYGLEIEPSDLHPDQPSLQATGGEPVCIHADLLTTLLLQLEAGSSSKSNGYLSAGLETQNQVCQPTLVLYGGSFESTDGAESSDHSGGPFVMASLGTQSS